MSSKLLGFLWKHFRVVLNECLYFLKKFLQASYMHIKVKVELLIDNIGMIQLLPLTHDTALGHFDSPAV